MNSHELHESIKQAPLASRATLERLYLYVTAGDQVTPAFQQYLTDAENYQDFFNAIYADDDKKNTQVWAEWANLTRKSWIGRFKPDICLQKLRFKTDGLPIGFEGGVMLAPTGSRDGVTDFYVFKSGAFNTVAADFVTSIGGRFTCAGYDFLGVYGVYQYRGSVILEAWQEEREPMVSEKQ